MKTNSTIRGIAHGHMTKDNLTGFASMMTSDARTLSLARIAMNLPVYLDMGEEPSDEYTRISKLSAAYCGLLGRVNKELVSGLDEKREDEALSLRKESTQIMELLSAYTDRFTVYEYVLNRLEYRFSGASLEAGYSDEDMTQEILQKLSSETDQTVRQSMLVSIIEQLPMRMTRKRFFQVLAEGMDAYKGSDKEAVDGQLFMLRTAAMLEEPAEFKQSFPEFYEVVETFKQAPLSAVSEAEWNKLHDMLADAMEELNSQMDRMLLLQELINDLCVVTMTDSCTWTEQHKTCSSIISFTLTPGTDEAALNAMLTALEGIQEQYSMTFQEKSTLVDELMQSSKEQLSEQGMIETFSKLEVLSKLLSSSRFADIEQKQESETVEASYIEEQTAANKKVSDEQVAEVKALLENATSQLDSIKTDLSEKVHSENVKCYRNIQDLFNEFDSKIEKMDEMEKSVGAVKGYVKVLSWFSIINFVMLVAFILYSLGVFNF